MTEQNQDIELHDDENEIVEAQAHDPKNAEAQSVASVDAAGDATGSAPKRKTDNTKQDPMPKTKGALMAAMVSKMQGMKKDTLLAMYKEDAFAADGEAIAESEELDYSVDSHRILMHSLNQRQLCQTNLRRKHKQSLKQLLSLSSPKKLTALKRSTTKNWLKKLNQLKLTSLKKSTATLIT